VQSQIYPKVLDLVQSNLLQGLALESLLSLYAALVKANAKKFGFSELLESLLGLATKPLAKQSQSSIAQCVASLCVAAQGDLCSKSVDRFIDDVKKGKNTANEVQALLCIGEIGRRVDLSSHTGLQSVVLGAMDGSEEEKSAASFCLGNVCVGNIEKFLPSILKEIKETPKKQYLLLQSLEEVISRSTSAAGAKALLPYLDSILQLLFDNTECEEEGARTVVAKCLGKLALISPAQLLPALQKRVGETATLTRATVVTAVKYAIVDVPHEVDGYLATSIGDFLRCLADKELEVRRAALLTLNYAAHNKPGLIRPILTNHLDALYEETKLKEELIKVVNLGPFKHKVDEGLENRKAAFECLYTLLDACIDKLDITALIKHLVAGLEDVYDIKLLCFLMLSRLAQHAGTALVTSLDSLVEPLRKTLTTKVRDTAVKQQVDRNDELIRSALVAIAAISRLDDVDSSLKFDEFIKTSVKTGPHAEAFDAILKETAPKQVESN
jgi:cullin-associated NEDD8-dissociated protein 1